MKSFIASLVILGILLLCSVINSIYIDRLSDKMLELEKIFPEKSEDGECPPNEKISEALSLWDESKPRLLAAAKNSYVNAISAALYNAADFYEHGAPADYIAARRLLREAVKALQMSDSLSLLGII